MSEKYDEYIKEHKNNVYEAFKWIKENIPEVLPPADELGLCEYHCQSYHDVSKYNQNEYEAYDAYFYGGNKSYEVVNAFKYAWLKHIHENEHHWQHWILINDDPQEGTIALDMPDIYIIEMVCDWMSFSIAKGDMNELFAWYNAHKDHMILSDYTRMKVEGILEAIKNKLAESDANVPA